MRPTDTPESRKHVMFSDYRLMNGQIASQCRHDTRGLAQPAVVLCAGIYRLLQGGKEQAGHGVSGLPDLTVRLGLPEILLADMPAETRARCRAPGRWFSIYEPAAQGLPLSMNLVLPSTPRDAATNEQDRYAIATAVGLSFPGQRPMPDDGHIAVIEKIWGLRPVLVTVLGPGAMQASAPILVPLAADFSTCFAAAILTDPNPVDDPGPVEFVSQGAINDLLLAINHYISTGDHVGEGIVVPDDGDPACQYLMASVPVDPANPTDSRDMQLLRLRLNEISAEGGPKTEWINTGRSGRFEAWALRLREADAPALTAALRAKPSAKGWGSVKALVDIATGGRKGGSR